jgi:hypothetical protein
MVGTTVTGEALSQVPEDFVEKVDLDLAPTHTATYLALPFWQYHDLVRVAPRGFGAGL